MQKDPTEEDLRSPEFQAIWLAIKDWDISRGEESSTGNRLYAGATGTDVMTIINAVRSIWTCRECHTIKYEKDTKINCCPTHNKEVCVNCFQKLHPDDPFFKENDDTRFIDIGPECFADKDALVISYKGENYYKACGIMVKGRLDGGATTCVKRVNHKNECEDYDGDTRAPLEGVKVK